jgi:hypothetical protein
MAEHGSQETPVTRAKTIGAEPRLGLSHAALAAAISADLGEIGYVSGEVMARVVADAIDANNAELLRQIKSMLAALEA